MKRFMMLPTLHRRLLSPFALSAGFLVCTFTALLSAVLGLFSPVLILICTLGGVGVGAWISRKKPKASPKGFWKFQAGFGLIAFLLASPPSEMIPGGWDPGVYLQTAAQIREHRSLVFDHPDLRELPRPFRTILFRDVHGIPEPFGGMRLDPEGRVTPQFYHAYPAFLAFISSLVPGLIWPMLLVNPVLGGLNTVLIMNLGRRWTGSTFWGCVAGAFYLLIPTQVWQFSFSTAEMLTQTFFLGGWIWLHEWNEDPQNARGAPVLAGAYFGMAVLTRYDSIMVWMILLPVLGVSLGYRKYRVGVGGILLGALPCLVLWCLHQRVAPYYSPLGPMVNKLVMMSLILTGAGAAGAFLLPLTSLWGKTRIGLLGLATAGWWMVMGLLWWVRPWISSRGEFAAELVEKGYTEFAASLTSPSKVSLLYWESNLHAVGLGIVLFLTPALWWTARNPARFALALSGAGVWLVLSWNPFNDLFMMWVTRRFVPVVVPWVVLGAVTGLVVLEGRLQKVRWKPARWLPMAFALVLLALPFRNAWFQSRIRDWSGTTAWFAETAQLIPDDAVLLTDQPGFGSPFRFIWGKSAFELRRQTPENLGRFLKRHQRRPLADEVYVLSTSELLKTAPGWEKVKDVPLATTMQSTHQYKFPRSTQTRGGEFVLYRSVR